jgi:hypothetical protein
VTSPPVLPPEVRGRFVGRRAVVAGSGPSLETVDPVAIRASGLVVICVNHAVTRVRPDVWIGFDPPGLFPPELWDDPGILKITDAVHWPLVRAYPDVATVRVGHWSRPADYWSSPVLGWNRKGYPDSFVTVFRLARDLGLVELNLIGVDYRGPDEAADRRFAQLNRYLDDLAPSIRAAGLAVWQCTRRSGLTAFPRRSLEEALAGRDS